MTKVQSVINVVAGREYQLKIIDITKDLSDDLFYDLYRSAFKEVGKIVLENSNKEKDITETANNIIAFCGERGQGKSSAMLSFSKLLNNYQKEKVINSFSGCMEDITNCSFHILSRIDPTELENCHSILSVIISRIFHDFKRIVDTNKEMSKTTINKLLQQFQQCYKDIDVVKDKNAFEKLNYGFEDDLEKLSMLSDSANIKKDFSDLVNSFLEFVFDKKQKNYLVIQIDDTDLNVSNAYEIVEDIRKYFMIPNVIVLMATNADLLLYAIEQYFQKSFKELIEKKELSIQKTHEMAAKYINKLIPGSRRIDLPDIEMNGSKDRFHNLGIEYIDVDETGKKEETKLLEYKNKNGDKIISFQETILRFIFEKTGLIFVKSKNHLHRIIPYNTRTLANFLSVLNDMKSLRHVNDINELSETEIEIRINNLKKFEEYFINTWIEENVDISVRGYLAKWIKSPVGVKNKQIVYFLSRNMSYDSILYGNKSSTVNSLYSRIYNFYDDQISKNIFKEFTIYDVIEFLTMIEVTLPEENIYKLSFAIKTLSSIEMNMHIWQQILAEKKQIKNNNFNFEIDIVNSIGDIWGDKVDKFMRKENNRISRAKGNSKIPKSFLGRYYSENSNQLDNYIVTALFYNVFGDRESNVNFTFNVSYPLIRLIQPMGFAKMTIDTLNELLSSHPPKNSNQVKELNVDLVQRINSILGKVRMAAIYSVANVDMTEKLELDLEFKKQTSSNYCDNLKNFYTRIETSLHDLDYLCLNNIELNSLVDMIEKSRSLVSDVFKHAELEAINNTEGFNFYLSSLTPYTKTKTLDLLKERIIKTTRLLRGIEKSFPIIDLKFELGELEEMYASLIKKERLSENSCLNSYQPRLNRIIKAANQKLNMFKSE